MTAKAFQVRVFQANAFQGGMVQTPVQDDGVIQNPPFKDVRISKLARLRREIVQRGRSK